MARSVEYIISRQNALVKLTASLVDRKFREKEGLFRFDGKKLFLEALAADVPLFAVLLRENVADAMLSAAGGALPEACRCVTLPEELFDRISEEKSPEGVICIAKRLEQFHKIVEMNESAAFEQALLPGHTLLLESVRDPGNLGTVIRSAAAFGVSQVVLSADCADLYHPRTLRAAMGTLFHTRVLIPSDFTEAVRRLGQRGRVFAAALDSNARALGQFELAENDAVIVGNEGHGISAAVLAAATDTVYIPMAPGVESLNAGVAASVLLWEFYRGR